MKKISKETFINEYDDISLCCHKSHEIFNVDDELVIMDIKDFKDQESQILLKEKIINIEFQRINGNSDYSIEELDSQLREILKV